MYVVAATGISPVTAEREGPATPHYLDVGVSRKEWGAVVPATTLWNLSRIDTAPGLPSWEMK
ncbi:hypothetical protein CGL51_00230 [Pyrobaculum aerophilum]|uniref:Uncharacterized protein n=2 Tax=Pyrobaculum aerophilum TaxID=13773 RepID=A0A371R413_9CREN|nr:hypothetical protein CGL51_00230 [Pyrobaculum aerophilum]RFA99995.1 hypothetical protein CGL52_02195 [Pyrobaculum aerophilum]